MRALGFEPKKEEIKKMISDIDKDGSGRYYIIYCPCIYGNYMYIKVFLHQNFLEMA